jgi:hypothetical protein
LESFPKKIGGSKISQIHLRKTHIVEKTTKFVQNKKKLTQPHIHTKTTRNEFVISLRLIMLGGGGEYVNWIFLIYSSGNRVVDKLHTNFILISIDKIL